MDRVLQARLEQDPTLRIATEWFFELRSNDVSVERISEWQRWLAASVSHRQAFSRVESFWQMGSRAVTTRWPTDAEVAADTYDGEESISAWREPTRVRPNTNRFRLALAAGVASTAIALGWVAMAPRHPDTEVSTKVGETRTLTLPDGSTVTAGGDTALTTLFSSRSREINLERGEAFFHVAKDPARHFTVHAGRAAVTAVGTAFNVRKAGKGVIVAVSEGSVRVVTPQSDRETPPAQLKAGQQLSVEPDARAQVSSVAANTVAGWRQGRLQYTNEPLETVVADLARYSTRDIRIEDEEVARLRVTGIVFEQNIDGWLSSLQATFPVQVVRDASSDSVTLRSGSR